MQKPKFLVDLGNQLTERNSYWKKLLQREGSDIEVKIVKSDNDIVSVCLYDASYVNEVSLDNEPVEIHFHTSSECSPKLHDLRTVLTVLVVRHNRVGIQCTYIRNS